MWITTPVLFNDMTVDLTEEIDKAGYAILNAVSLDQWLAYLLAGDAPMEEIMNMPSHGLGAEALAERFFRLWNSGLLECSIEESGPPVAPNRELARSQFVRTRQWPPEGDESVVYRLSRDGGAIWEYFASPDWGKFFKVETDYDLNECRLASANRDLAETLRQCEDRHPAPIAGTDRWTVLQPWNATYWKMLPNAYQLTFRVSISSSLIGYNRLGHTHPACQQVTENWRLWRKSFEQACREHFGGNK